MNEEPTTNSEPVEETTASAPGGDVSPKSESAVILDEMNKLGQKVAIVSAKAQTTRARLLGIAIEGEAQIILADTPGLFEPRRRLDRAMVNAAWDGAQEADAEARLDRARLLQQLPDVLRGFVRVTGMQGWHAIPAPPRLARLPAPPASPAPQPGHQRTHRRIRLGLTIGNYEHVRPHGRRRLRKLVQQRLTLRHQTPIFQHQRQHDIAHAEPARRQRRTAEGFDQIVISPAAGDGALTLGDDLEDGAGVIRKAADDGNLGINPCIETGAGR